MSREIKRLVFFKELAQEERMREANHAFNGGARFGLTLAAVSALLLCSVLALTGVRLTQAHPESPAGSTVTMVTGVPPRVLGDGQPTVLPPADFTAAPTMPNGAAPPLPTQKGATSGLRSAPPPSD